MIAQPMKVLLAHPGTQYSYPLAAQLYRHQVLYRFWTGLALSSDSRLARLAMSLFPHGARERVAARVVEGIPPSHLRSLPSVEYRTVWSQHNRFAEQLILHERNRRFQDRIPERELRCASVVVGFDTSSWVLMERARKLGIPAVLDRSICHPLTQQAAFARAKVQFPDWNDHLVRREDVVLDCEAREHMAASRIVVPSHFTKASLEEHGVAADKIRVNPYGVDLERFRPAESSDKTRPLRFIFVGSVGLRKGVPLLLRAWEALSLRNAELWLVGAVPPSVQSRIPALPGLTVLGRRSHAELPALLADCDVMVLPSYAEGFPLAQVEAMACGLPVITTTAAAGQDLIADSSHGFVITPGDLDALVDAMRFLVVNSERLPVMSRAARARACSFSWDVYGDRWLEILQELH